MPYIYFNVPFGNLAQCGALVNILSKHIPENRFPTTNVMYFLQRDEETWCRCPRVKVEKKVRHFHHQLDIYRSGRTTRRQYNTLYELRTTQRSRLRIVQRALRFSQHSTHTHSL